MAARHRRVSPSLEPRWMHTGLQAVATAQSRSTCTRSDACGTVGNAEGEAAKRLHVADRRQGSFHRRFRKAKGRLETRSIPRHGPRAGEISAPICTWHV